jgi:hypothetical protein
VLPRLAPQKRIDAPSAVHPAADARAMETVEQTDDIPGRHPARMPFATLSPRCLLETSGGRDGISVAAPITFGGHSSIERYAPGSVNETAYPQPTADTAAPRSLRPNPGRGAPGRASINNAPERDTPVLSSPPGAIALSGPRFRATRACGIGHVLTTSRRRGREPRKRPLGEALGGEPIDRRGDRRLGARE